MDCLFLVKTITLETANVTNCHVIATDILFLSSNHRSVQFLYLAASADLNVTCLNNPRETEKLVSKAVKLGFETIAICQAFRLETVKKERKGAAKLTPVNLGNYPAIQDMKKINPRLKVYTRLTVQLDDQSQVHQLSSDPVQSHDILAVQPATEKLFQQA